jgi:hypothetical protein
LEVRNVVWFTGFLFEDRIYMIYRFLHFRQDLQDLQDKHRGFCHE